MEQNHNENDTYIYYGTSLSSRIKRNKGLTCFIIGSIIFALLCVAITGIAIGLKKSIDADKAKKLSKEQLKQQMEQMKVSSLSDRYKQNDLDTIYYVENIGKSRDNLLEQDEKTTKLTIKYMAIKGLKNKEIENKINSKISAEMVKLYTSEEINNPNVDYVNISGYITGNYANALSIYLLKSTKNIGDSQERKQGKSINIDLTTGNDISFEELFLPGVSVKNVLTQVVYDNLINQAMKQSIVINNSIEVSGIEEKVYNIVNKYKKGKIKEFYFNSSTICFLFENEWYSFDMWKYYDKIGIYNRFKTAKSIFDGTHQKIQENFIFQEIRDELVNQKISNNFIALIVTPYNLSNRSEAFIRKFNEFFDSAKIKVQELKQEAEKNTDQTIIFASKINIDNINDYWSYTPEGQPTKKSNLLSQFEICETSKSDSIIRISNLDYKNKLILEMYKRNYSIEKFADMTVEELFSLVGTKAKIEFSRVEKTISELTTNRPIEDIIDEQFKAKSDEIEAMIKDTTKEQDITQIEAKVAELFENLEILRGKFANQENEKIKNTEQKVQNSIEVFEKDIYNIKLKKEIQVVFDNQLKELNEKKQDNNIELVEEKAYYLSQVLNAYQNKNVNNNSEISNVIMNYSKEIVSLQEWAIKTRQKKIEEERKKKEEEERRRQNQINNNNTIYPIDFNAINNITTNTTTNSTSNTNTTNTTTSNTSTTNTTNTNRLNYTNEIIYTLIEF